MKLGRTPLTQTLGFFCLFYICLWPFSDISKRETTFYEHGYFREKEKEGKQSKRSSAAVCFVFWWWRRLESWRWPHICRWSRRWNRKASAKSTRTFAIKQPLFCSQTLYHLFKVGRLSCLPSNDHGKYSLSIKHETKRNLPQTTRLGESNRLSCESIMEDKTTDSCYC